MSFYMTLPCDSSRSVFPDNRVGNYSSILAREIVLDGDYEVGLSEIVMPVPNRLKNVEQTIIFSEIGRGRGYFKINVAQLSSVSDLSAIETPKTHDGRTAFEFSELDGKVVLTVAAKCQVYLGELCSELAALLGFELGGYGGGDESTDHIAKVPFTPRNSLYFIYVYCDIVEYSFVGDSMVPCLRALPVIPGYDKPTILRFENPHYVPVSKSRFSSVAIELADPQGEDIKFSKGLSLVKLHFRPKER